MLPPAQMETVRCKLVAEMLRLSQGRVQGTGMEKRPAWKSGKVWSDSGPVQKQSSTSADGRQDEAGGPRRHVGKGGASIGYEVFPQQLRR